MHLMWSREALHESNRGGNFKSRSRRDLLFLDATNRVPVSSAVVAHFHNVFHEKEEVARFVVARTGRPIEGIMVSIHGAATAAVAITGSREEYLRLIFPERMSITHGCC